MSLLLYEDPDYVAREDYVRMKEVAALRVCRQFR